MVFRKFSALHPTRRQATPRGLAFRGPSHFGHGLTLGSKSSEFDRGRHSAPSSLCRIPHTTSGDRQGSQRNRNFGEWRLGSGACNTAAPLNEHGPAREGPASMTSPAALCLISMHYTDRGRGRPQTCSARSVFDSCNLTSARALARIVRVRPSARVSDELPLCLRHDHGADEVNHGPRSAERSERHWEALHRPAGERHESRRQTA